MRWMRIRVLAVVLAGLGGVATAPAVAQSQDDDQSRLITFIEDSLSDGAARQIDIVGFRGALSSQAQLERLTIADEDGIWLVLEGAILDWTRSALLSRELRINALTAERLEIRRPPLPAGASGPTLPDDAAAQPFRLPELPVAIEVGEFRIDRVDLGPAFIGDPVALRVSGQASLEDGDGQVAIDIDRLDGVTGRFDLQADFSNATEDLSLLLDLEEGQGGLAANRLSLPGEPAVALGIDGTGTLSNFAADVTLATGGEDRLAGQVTLAEVDGAQRITADLGGDITPLVAPEIAGFFGPDAALSVRAARLAGGGLDIDTLQVRTADLALEGAVRLASDGVPSFFDITGRLGNAGPDAAPVRLPVAGAPVTVRNATLDLGFDAAAGEAWTARFVARGLTAEDLDLDRLVVSGDGTIATTGATAVTGDLQVALAGLALADAAAAEALGPALTARAAIDWSAGRSLRLSDLQVRAQTLSLSADAEMAGGLEDLQIDLSAGLQVDRLAAFAPLAATPLAGRVDTRLDGVIRPLEGAFDLRLDGDGEDLRLGPAVTGDLFAGTTTFALTARRDTEGTFVEEARITSPELTFTGAASATGGGETLQVGVDAGITLADLSILSSVVGTPLAGTLDVQAEGRAQPGPMDFALTVTGTGENLRYGTGSRELDLPGTTRLDIEASRSGGLIDVEQAELVGPDLDLVADIATPNPSEPDALAYRIDLALDDLSRLSGLAGTPLGGRIDIAASGDANLATGDVGVALEGTGMDLQLGDDLSEALLQGRTRLDIVAERRDGVVAVDRLRLYGPGLSLDATLAGEPEGGDTRYAGTLEAGIDNIAAFSQLAGIELAGAVEVSGAASIVPSSGDFTVDLAGAGTDLQAGPLGDGGVLDGRSEFAIVAERQAGQLLVEEARLASAGVNATGRAAPRDGSDEIGIAAEVEVASLAAFSALAGQPLAGAVSARLDGTLDPATQDLTVTLDATIRDLQAGPPITAELFANTTTLSLAAERSGSRILIRDATVAGPQISAELSGELGDADTAVTGRVRLADVGLFTEALSGAVTSDLTLRSQGAGPIRIETVNRGPGGLTVSVNGAVGLPGGTVDLLIGGTAPLALADPILGTRSLRGTAQLDLAMQGAPGLDAVTGTVTASGARLSAPRLGNAIEGIEARLTLRGGTAQVEANGGLATGGRIAVTGRLGLGAPQLPATLMIEAAGLRLINPQLYDATIEGVSLVLDGELAGASALSGQIALGRVEVRIPSSGLGGAEPIPEIDHLGVTPSQRLTQDRAGLLEDGAGLGPPPPPPAGPGGGERVSLDIDVVALSRIFVRGRGLDAELGGRLSLAGSLNRAIPSGQFDLLRGRLSLLGRRLDLTEGFITLQGDFAPFLRLVAVSDVDDFSVRIIVEGPLQDPEITFSSVPDLPQDEILARLFFGQNVQNLSAIQALQLASAVAELSGRSSGGILLSLREGLGLDNLDVRTDDGGNAAVTAGRYISDNVYTDVTVGATGDAEVTLNIDLSPGLTARGTAGSDGNSAIGLYFERDY